MKVMSYTCPQEELEEKRNWLLSLGLTLFRQTTVYDLESYHPDLDNRAFTMFTFFVTNKETETFLRLSFPEGTFKDCSA